MKKFILTSSITFLTALASFAANDSIPVNRARLAGPFTLKQPIIIDSTSVAQEKYSGRQANRDSSVRQRC